jgi:hypothetical protein
MVILVHTAGSGRGSACTPVRSVTTIYDLLALGRYAVGPNIGGGYWLARRSVFGPLPSRFRSPDGNMVTHALFCKHPKEARWILSRGYQNREAAEQAIAQLDPADSMNVDYVIVEREPL